ncbi:MAG: hypothetical protein IT424_02730, partial [Pirellulales bacterium]|nr:hypothetical protein [Pirellulales bacterium]
MQEIKVHVVKSKGRTNLSLRYVDPDSGKQVWKSAGTANPKKALQEAGKWQAELREGRYQRTSRMPWDEFREQYERVTSDGQKLAMVRNYASALNAFEALCRPTRVADLNTAKVTAFAVELRHERKRRDGS